MQKIKTIRMDTEQVRTIKATTLWKTQASANQQMEPMVETTIKVQTTIKMVQTATVSRKWK